MGHYLQCLLMMLTVICHSATKLTIPFSPLTNVNTLCSMFKFISLSLILLDLLWQKQQWQWLKVVKNVGWWVGAKVQVIPTFQFLLIIPAAFVNSTHNTKSHWLDLQSPFQQHAQIWALVVQIQTLAPCLLPILTWATIFFCYPNQLLPILTCNFPQCT